MINKEYKDATKYLTKIMLENDNIYKYEAKCAVRAFISTLYYFMLRSIPFKLINLLTFKVLHKEKKQQYVPYNETYHEMPEHLDIRITPAHKLHWYLNKTRGFENALHRKHLPENVEANKLTF